jgi:hypothetical protein
MSRPYCVLLASAGRTRRGGGRSRLAMWAPRSGRFAPCAHPTAPRPASASFDASRTRPHCRRPPRRTRSKTQATVSAQTPTTRRSRRRPHRPPDPSRLRRRRPATRARPIGRTLGHSRSSAPRKRAERGWWCRVRSRARFMSRVASVCRHITLGPCSSSTIWSGAEDDSLAKTASDRSE